MLNTTKWEVLTHQPKWEQAHREPGNGQLARALDEETTFIEVQHYLDFKYGANSVDITLPGDVRARLVVGAEGRVYFQVLANG